MTSIPQGCFSGPDLPVPLFMSLQDLDESDRAKLIDLLTEHKRELIDREIDSHAFPFGPFRTLQLALQSKESMGLVPMTHVLWLIRLLADIESTWAKNVAKKYLHLMLTCYATDIAQAIVTHLKGFLTTPCSSATEPHALIVAQTLLDDVEGLNRDELWDCICRPENLAGLKVMARFLDQEIIPTLLSQVTPLVQTLIRSTGNDLLTLIALATRLNS